MKLIKAKGDGNCVFNAALLGLLDLINADKLDNDKARQGRILDLLKKSPTLKDIADWEALKKKLATFTEKDLLAIQESVSGELRNIIAQYIEANMPRYADHLIAEAKDAFQIYSDKSSDSSAESIKYYTVSHPSIKALFDAALKDKDNAEKNLDAALDKMFKKDGGKEFCKEMANNAVKDRSYENHLALAAFGDLFGIDVKLYVGKDKPLNLNAFPIVYDKKKFNDKVTAGLLKAGIIIVSNSDKDVYYYDPKFDQEQIYARLDELEKSRDDVDADKEDEDVVMTKAVIGAIKQEWEAGAKEVYPTLAVKHSGAHYDYLTDNEWLAKIYNVTEEEKDTKDTAKDPTKTTANDEGIIIPVEDLRTIIAQGTATRTKVFTVPGLDSWGLFSQRKSGELMVNFDDESSVNAALLILGQQDARFKDRQGRCELAVSAAAMINVAIAAILTAAKEFIRAADDTSPDINTSSTNSTQIVGNSTQTTLATTTSTTPASDVDSSNAIRWLDLSIIIVAALAAFTVAWSKRLSTEAATDISTIREIKTEIDGIEEKISEEVIAYNTTSRKNNTLRLFYEDKDPAAQVKALNEKLKAQKESRPTGVWFKTSWLGKKQTSGQGSNQPSSSKKGNPSSTKNKSKVANRPS